MYELWDAVSGNLLKSYPTEAAALAAVRAFADAYGDPAAEGLGVISLGQGWRVRSPILDDGGDTVGEGGARQDEYEVPAPLSKPNESEPRPRAGHRACQTHTASAAVRL